MWSKYYSLEILFVLLMIISCNKTEDLAISCEQDTISFNQPTIKLKIKNNSDENFIIKFNPFELQYFAPEDKLIHNKLYIMGKDKNGQFVNFQSYFIADLAIPIPPIDSTDAATIEQINNHNKFIKMFNEIEQHNNDLFKIPKHSSIIIEVKNPLPDDFYNVYFVNTNVNYEKLKNLDIYFLISPPSTQNTDKIPAGFSLYEKKLLSAPIKVIK
uniref:hypothetical protein n=1 Tax=Ornithobacterium rhinotracheale TaxID=28251 RepID=UPI00129C8AEA|nr:hypothetical protein [Ornithobacterium rhinotracheale]